MPVKDGVTATKELSRGIDTPILQWLQMLLIYMLRNVMMLAWMVFWLSH